MYVFGITFIMGIPSAKRGRENSPNPLKRTVREWKKGAIKESNDTPSQWGEADVAEKVTRAAANIFTTADRVVVALGWLIHRHSSNVGRAIFEKPHGKRFSFWEHHNAQRAASRIHTRRSPLHDL